MPVSLLEFVAARLAEPTEHEPCRLLCDADFLGELHATDTLARGHQEVHRIDPLVQRDMRPFEDRSGADREVFLALVAAVEPAFASRDPLPESAERAEGPFGQRRLSR